MSTSTEQHLSTLRPWSTPRLNELDLSITKLGPSPNIQETQLTDETLLSS